MPIISTLTAGDRQRSTGTFQKVASFTVATSTVAQVINVDTDLALINGSTATGSTVGLFTLGSGVEGQEINIIFSGTGEAKVALTGTATGQYVFTATEQWSTLKWVGGKWRAILQGATIATAT